MKKKQLDGRIALITGASSGIGRAVAMRFVEEGAHVILVSRNTAALESLDTAIQNVSGIPATLVPIDLSNFQDIDLMGGALFDRFGKLDIFIGNAGVLGALGPLSHTTSKNWDEVLSVNLTANFRLIRTLDPLLRKSTSGRVIFVTSTVGHKVREYWGAYSISKAGAEMLARIYAAEVKKTDIKVNIINPGKIRTSMRAAAYPGEDKNTVPPPNAITHEFVRLATPECQLHGQLILAKENA